MNPAIAAPLAGLLGGLVGMAARGRRRAEAALGLAFAAPALLASSGSASVFAAMASVGAGVIAARLASRDRDLFPLGLWSWPMAGVLSAGAGLIHPALTAPIGLAAALGASMIDGREGFAGARRAWAMYAESAAILLIGLAALIPALVLLGSTCGLAGLLFLPLAQLARLRRRLRRGARLSEEDEAISSAGLIALGIVIGVLGLLAITGSWSQLLIHATWPAVSLAAAVGRFRLGLNGFSAEKPLPGRKPGGIEGG